MTSGMGMRVLPTLLTRVSSTSMKITEGLFISSIALKWVDGCQKGRLKKPCQILFRYGLKGVRNTVEDLLSLCCTDIMHEKPHFQDTKELSLKK